MDTWPDDWGDVGDDSSLSSSSHNLLNLSFNEFASIFNSKFEYFLIFCTLRDSVGFDLDLINLLPLLEALALFLGSKKRTVNGLTEGEWAGKKVMEIPFGPAIVSFIC